MILEYRKRPVIIQAVQFNGKSSVKSLQELGLDISNPEHEIDEVIISTKEGDMKASLGDYVIKGIKGEFYPCKPDIFIETYEVVLT